MNRCKAGRCLTLISAAVLLIAAVFAVVLAVAAEGRRDALTVPALQQTLALTGCTHTHSLCLKRTQKMRGHQCDSALYSHAVMSDSEVET